MRRQLAALGYTDLPEPVFREFMEDLLALADQENKPQPMTAAEERSYLGKIRSRKTASQSQSSSAVASEAGDSAAELADRLHDVQLDAHSSHAAPVAPPSRPSSSKSVIWSRELPRLPKTDRMARAQEFRRQWQARGGVPGEEKHAALRWRVREQLERNKEAPWMPPSTLRKW